jgi:transposase-like protein
MKSGLADQAANRKGARRRRFWSSDEKRRMVAESFTPGASVSTVAQRYGVNANLLFTWRRREARNASVNSTACQSLHTVLNVYILARSG